jgi:hypothetical protein
MKKLSFILFFLFLALSLNSQSFSSVGLTDSEVIYENNWVRTRVDINADSSRLSYKSYCVIDPVFTYPIIRDIHIMFSVALLTPDVIIDSVFIALYCPVTSANVGMSMFCNPNLKFNILDLVEPQISHIYPPVTDYVSVGWNTYKLDNEYIRENYKYPSYMSFSIMCNPVDRSCGVESSVYFYLFHSTLNPILTIYYHTTPTPPAPKKIKIIGVI